MLTLRKSEDRGHIRMGWLDTRHSFSFGQYYDPQHMGFGPLRVINEDIVAPSKGFGSHPHRDMEILTYVMDGALEHKDSLGTGSIIVPGDVQRMSAGTGIIHSEFNPLEDRPVHLLQIWIMPEREGIAPGYEQANFTEKRAPGKLTLLASRDGREGSLTIHQDASLSVLDMASGGAHNLTLNPSRKGWIQMASGEATLNEIQLKQGDGLAIQGESSLTVNALNDAELLVFDLPS